MPDLHLDHQQGISCFGSCFAAHMAKRLQDAKFDCLLNPFGILFNPVSIAQSIDKILEDYTFNDADLVKNENRWFSLWHHSSFSNQQSNKLRSELQMAAQEAKQKIKQTSLFIFTFGSAYYYQHKATNIVAANCHKLPKEQFEKKRFSEEEITNHFCDTLNKLSSINPNAQFVFTVSPIRHAKDGLIENTRSKATLHLSIFAILKQFSQAVYFPSFEIMMDDLRDYRFYGPDMLHPTDTAIDYIWKHFTDNIFSKDTHNLTQKIKAIQMAVAHSPFHANSQGHQKFIRNTLQKIEDVQKGQANLNFDNERAQLEGQLI
jgi:hypothetical protein